MKTKTPLVIVPALHADKATIRHHMRRQPFIQLALCFVITMLLALPHLAALPARDEADAIVAAQTITQRGVPVFYQGDPDFTGDQLITLGRTNIPGLPGQSTIVEAQNQLGAQTWVEHGGVFYKVGNWHPPLYLYMLAAIILLPLPMPLLVAFRLLNLVLLLVSLTLLFGIARALTSHAPVGAQSPTDPPVSDHAIPLITCLAYVLVSFGLRAHLLIEYTTTIAPVTVLLYWFVHLRAREHGWRGTILRACTFALVAWANLGPLVPLAGALILVPLLHGRGRRALAMLVSCGLGFALFLVTFTAFSLWEGIPASATLTHSQGTVVGALAILPHPNSWAHLGAPAAMFVLVALFYGPPALTLATVVGLRHTSWRPRLTRRTIRGLGLGSFVVGLVCASAYLLWQQVSILSGLVLTGLWALALADLFALNWASMPFIWWLLPCLAFAALLAAAKLVRWPSEQIQSMALFAGGITVVALLAGARAWGFPKYIAPAYGVLVLLAVTCLVGLYTGNVRLGGRPSILACGIGLVALFVLIWLPDFTCTSPDVQTGLCSNTAHAALSLWIGAFTALSLLLVGLFFGLRLSAWHHQLLATPPLTAETSRLAALLFLLLLLPLLLFAIPEQVELARTSGDFAYDTGNLVGMQEAGAYLRAHVGPGQGVVARKEIMIYAPNVRFVDDTLLPDDYLATHPQIVWVALPSLNAPGFSEVARFGVWGVYFRPPGQAPQAARTIAAQTRQIWAVVMSSAVGSERGKLSWRVGRGACGAAQQICARR